MLTAALQVLGAVQRYVRELRTQALLLLAKQFPTLHIVERMVLIEVSTEALGNGPNCFALDCSRVAPGYVEAVHAREFYLLLVRLELLLSEHLPAIVQTYYIFVL